MIRLQSLYFGSIPYWAAVAANKQIVIDIHEHFEKQSYRNRVMILGPNGPQALVVPIQGRNKKHSMGELRISYEEPWQRVHLNSLQTAYRSAPYFDYLYPEIASILLQDHALLMELNMDLLRFFIKRLKLDTEIHPSHAYTLLPTEQEGRENFHPKKENKDLPPYPQVFQEKYAFVSGLGLIDLLMNDLSGAVAYLKQPALR
ncbi:MAG: WbqC family protein [Bacteroidia bacterium]